MVVILRVLRALCGKKASKSHKRHKNVRFLHLLCIFVAIPTGSVCTLSPLCLFPATYGILHSGVVF